MDLLINVQDNYCEVSMCGRLDAGNAENLKNEFSEHLRSISYFIFDIRELEFIDSSGLGAIISCLKKAVEKKGDIKLVGLSPKVKMVFEVTRAYKIFDIFDDADAARASIAENGGQK